MSLIGEERKQIILNMLHDQGKVRTPELVKALQVSSETVRRHLEELEHEQKLKRVYGGAVKTDAMQAEPPLLQREELNLEEKQRIGRKAVELVQDHDIIFLDDGTTSLHMMEHLLHKKRLTVLTVSVLALNLLIDYKNKGRFDGEILFVGGRINANHSRVSGALAQQFAESIHVDKAFLVADGLHVTGGVTSYDDERGMLARIFLKHSRQAIVLSDHSKLGSIQFHKIADLEEVDIVISDVHPPDKWQEKLAASGLHWVTADPK